MNKQKKADQPDNYNKKQDKKQPSGKSQIETVRLRQNKTTATGINNKINYFMRRQ